MKKLCFKCLYFMLLAILTQACGVKSSPPGVNVESYRSYVNNRVGFSIDYPDIYEGYVQDEQDENKIIFALLKESYGLTIHGWKNEQREKAGKLLEKRLEQVSKLVPNSERSGTDYYSLTYGNQPRDNGKVHLFHEYGFVTSDVVVTFILYYPQEEEKQFAEVADRMKESIKRLNLSANKKSDRRPTYYVQDETLHYGSTMLRNLFVNEVMTDRVRYWSVIDDDEDGLGLYIFDKKGKRICAIPIESEVLCQEVLFSPSGEWVVVGGANRTDLDYVLYNVEKKREIMSFVGLRYGVDWIDTSLLIYTKIEDGIREGGSSFATQGYGLVSSVVTFDLVLMQEIPVKEAAETQNFMLSNVDHNKEEITIIEEYVKKVKHWSTSKKIKQREIKQPFPAHG